MQTPLPASCMRTLAPPPLNGVSSGDRVHVLTINSLGLDATGVADMSRTTASSVQSLAQNLRNHAFNPDFVAHFISAAMYCAREFMQTKTIMSTKRTVSRQIYIRGNT